VVASSLLEREIIIYNGIGYSAAAPFMLCIKGGEEDDGKMQATKVKYKLRGTEK
jgi:hypothetical protein